jgi:hypothetical protein
MADRNIDIRINAAVESAQAAQNIGQLRRSLLELQRLAEESDIGSQQFLDLQKQIAETTVKLADTRDKLEDFNDSMRTLKGTPVERLSASFGILKQSIFELDFEKAKTGLNGFVTAFTPLGPDGAPLQGLRAMGPTLKGIGSVLGSVGQGFLSLGRAILANPLFLLAGVIGGIAVGVVALLNKLGLLQPILSAIGSAVEFVTDAFNNLTEAIGINFAASENYYQKLKEGEEKYRAELERTAGVRADISSTIEGLTSRETKLIGDLTNTYIIEEESRETIIRKGLDLQLESIKKQKTALEDLQSKKKTLSKEEQEDLDSLRKKYDDVNVQIIKIETERYRKTQQLQEENQKKRIALTDNDFLRAQLQYDFDLKQTKIFEEERAKLLSEYRQNEIKAGQLQAYNQFQQAQLLLNNNIQIAARIKELTDSIKLTTDEANKRRTESEKQAQKEINDNYEKIEEQRRERVRESLRQIQNNLKLELLDAEGFAIRKLEIENTYSKKIEEFQLKNKDVFFKTETDKQLFLKESAAKRTKNEEEIVKLQKEQAEQITKQAIEIQKLTAKLNDGVTDEETKLRLLRLQLTEARFEYDLKIESAKTELDRERLILESKVKEKEILNEINKLGEDNVKRIQVEKANNLQLELNALNIILQENIKVDQSILESREKTIEFVKNLENMSEKKRLELAKMNTDEQISLIYQIEEVKKEQVNNDELTRTLEKNKITDLANYKLDLESLSIEELKNFNAQRIEIESQTSDQILQIRRDAREKDKQERQQELQFIGETANQTLNILQGLSDLGFQIKKNNLKKGTAEERKAAQEQFEINKALQVGSAIINGIQSILAITSVPDFTFGVQSAIRIGAQIALNAISIAKILSTKFEGGNVSSGGVPSLGGGGGGGPTTGNFNPPTEIFTPTRFYNLGNAAEGGGPNMENQGRVYVLESDITSVQKRVSVIEDRAKIY